MGQTGCTPLTPVPAWLAFARACLSLFKAWGSEPWNQDLEPQVYLYVASLGKASISLSIKQYLKGEAWTKCPCCGPPDRVPQTAPSILPS